MACGASSTLGVKNNGTLWGAGYNGNGEFGLGNDALESYNTFTKISSTGWRQVDFSYRHTLAVKRDGTMWSTGNNLHGQLGLGDTTSRNVFTRVEGSGWKKAFCGKGASYNSLALKKDRTLWGAGENAHGELGLGDDVERTSFTKVSYVRDFNLLLGWVKFYELSGWKEVDSGYTHSAAIKRIGTLWVTGYGPYGQLGLNSENKQRYLFTEVPGFFCKKVACGKNHTLALKSNGTLWGTGRNNLGQLGLGDNIDRWEFTQISGSGWENIGCGEDFSFAIKTDGTLWMTGDNSNGQFGLEDNINRNFFTKIGTSNDWLKLAGGMAHSAAIRR
jgi:alpha-tubulin suppressor-like RCC1 family protein